jgi:RNA polymerase sigma-70 factor, ECF subfamily
MSKRETAVNWRADEDRDMVSASRNGDVDAFGVLVGKYQKRAFNMAFRMIGDYDAACEIVQDTFLSAFTAIRQFRGEAKFSTWLYGICVNQARNRLKKQRVRALRETAGLDDLPDTGDGAEPREQASGDRPVDEQVVRKELQERVQRSINGLEQEYREVLVLRDIQGFSYEEIQAILNLPDGTVKSRLFRARDALRQSLKSIVGDL